VYLPEITRPPRVSLKTCQRPHLQSENPPWLSFENHPVRSPAMTRPELPRPTSAATLPFASLSKHPSVVRRSTYQDVLDKESKPGRTSFGVYEKVEFDNEDHAISSRCHFLIYISMALIILAIIRSRRCQEDGQSPSHLRPYFDVLYHHHAFVALDIFRRRSCCEGYPD